MWPWHNVLDAQVRLEGDAQAREEAMTNAGNDGRTDSHGIARRDLLKAAGVGSLALGMPGLLASSEASAKVPQADLLRKFGVEIPEVNIRFGMSAFADHNIYSIGIQNGWFDEVGITLGPGQFGVRSLSPQVIPRLVSGEVDIHTWYGPLQIEIMARVPHVKLFTFSDTYVGTYMLAAPNSGIRSVSQLVKEGVPFDTAITQVMAEMKGKRVGIDNTGSHRIFLDAIFELGGTTFKDVELSVLEDARLVYLARGGNLDYVSPAGAVQNVVLIQDGWYPAVSVEDLIQGLPAGDYRGVGSIGHTGLSTTDDYYRNNFDTVLRMASVMFRVIDSINEDIKNGTDHALKLEVPVIEAAAGAELGVDGLRTIFQVLDPLKSFEDQSEYWLEQDNPFHYWNVYMPQIKAAQGGGLLSKDKEFIPDDAFTAPHVYRTLLRYRRWYEQLVPKAKDLGGDKAKLAQQAAAYYENRDYLDAFRLLDAALKA